MAAAVLHVLPANVLLDLFINTSLKTLQLIYLWSAGLRDLSWLGTTRYSGETLFHNRIN